MSKFSLAFFRFSENRFLLFFNNFLLICKPFEKILVISFSAAILFLRAPDALLNPQFFAEDATVFFKQNYDIGIYSLFIPNAGYLHSIQRLVAFLAGFFNEIYSPFLYNLSAFAITLGVISYIYSDRLVLPFKSLIALSIVLVPHSGEVFLNITEIQFITAFILIINLLMKFPETRGEFFSDLLLLTIVGFTGPFLFIAAPLFMVKCIKNWSEYSMYIALLVLIIASIQGFLVIQARMPTKSIPVMHTILAFIKVFMKRLFGSLIIGFYRINKAPYFLSIFCFSIIIIYLYKFHPIADKWTIFVIIYFIVALSLAVSIKFVNDPETLMPVVNGDRYFFISRILMIWLIILSLANNNRLNIFSIFIIVCIILSIINSFSRPAFKDYRWKDNIIQYKSGAIKSFPINPEGWQFK